MLPRRNPLPDAPCLPLDIGRPRKTFPRGSTKTNSKGKNFCLTQIPDFSNTLKKNIHEYTSNNRYYRYGRLTDYGAMHQYVLCKQKS